ncbi:hypothetical protein FVQ98_14645 [Ottowia sp. GY511]|nr:hypothetical protein FVQ98_14645 [Ottowia sp. GY511]
MHKGNTPDGTPYFAERAAVEAEARTAAQAGATLLDACPYPFGTEAEEVFTAAFQRAGGRLQR